LCEESISKTGRQEASMIGGRSLSTVLASTIGGNPSTGSESYVNNLPKVALKPVVAAPFACVVEAYDAAA